MFDPDNVAVELPELANLGVDPIAGELTLPMLRRLLRSRHRLLKPLLLDQHVIAGIGNIYADEILHEARLRPDRMSDELGPAAERRLHAAIHRVLEAAIAAGGSTLGDAQYVDLYGEWGSYQEAHKVYGRAGERCLTCGVGWIRRTVTRPAQHPLLPPLPALTVGARHLPSCPRTESVATVTVGAWPLPSSGRVGATVFLKSLTLKGFKSFADATTMTLEPGVTVVVGPNGSGKSNIVDAVAWVLGAQAPRSVRSQKMDDVIFAGTEKRPALGRAEVSLTLDNTAGLLPIEFNEVTLTRILFRSGESEYAINGVPCRLLDLQELLSDAGVGRQQHVIVSQGQIDAVLNARPEERRAIIEEAAGVLKYRKRKEKAERRLDATEANLLRLQDLLREVRRQLRPLERQAEAARRHEELVARARPAAGVRRRPRDHVVAPQARVDRRRPHRGVPRRRASSSPTLARLDTEIMSFEAQLSARGESDVSDRLVHVEQLRERARGLAGILAERKRSLERDHGQLLDAGVVANLEADAARLRAELDEVDAALDRVAPETEALTAEEEAFAAGARPVRRVVRGLRRRRRPGRHRGRRGPRRAAVAAQRSRTQRERAAAGHHRAARRCAPASTNSSPRPIACAPTAPAPSRSRRRSSPRSSRRRPHRRLAEVDPRARHARPPRRVGGGVARRTPASRRCSWRSTPPTPAPAPSGWPASTACSARCSTWSRSTTAGSRRSRPHSARR